MILAQGPVPHIPFAASPDRGILFTTHDCFRGHEATRNKCIASGNKCLTLVETSATLVVTGALLVVTMFATRNKCLTTHAVCQTLCDSALLVRLRKMCCPWGQWGSSRATLCVGVSLNAVVLVIVLWPFWT